MSLGLSHLFSPPSEAESRKHAVRELGSSFASWDDLVKSDKLAARLDLVRKEVDDLQLELESCQALTSQIVGTSLKRTASLLDSAQGLSFERHELADLLSTLQDGADAPLPDDRSRTLRSRMSNLLQELDEATLGREYLLVLEELLRLQEATLVPSASLDAPLESYKMLLNFALRLHDALPATVALRDVARDIVRRTWQQLRTAHERALVAESSKIGWPLKVGTTTVSDADRSSFEAAFRTLLDLQARGETLHRDGALHPESGQPQGLYAYHALVEPVKLRWRFHFESSRPTNRLDKPEWAFGNILDLLHSCESTVDNWFGDLLEENGYPGIDSLSEFIAQLLPLPLSLLDARLPLLLPPAHPSLLAHTVHQTLLFDDRIREKGFSARRTLAAKPSWDGLTGEILRKGDVLNAWVEGERDFAREEFETIVSGEQTWTLVPLDELESDNADAQSDEERGLGSSSFVDLRPTRAAWALSKLLSQVTERYSPLPHFPQQLAFLLHVQLPLLSSYAAHLVAALAPLARTSSAFGRVVPGALAGHAGVTGLASEGDPKGADAARRAIAIWGAAKYLQRELEQWSDDVFFIQLHTAIGQDPVLRRQAQPALVVQASSREADPALFSADIERFHRLADRAEEALVKLVTGEVEARLRTHLTRRWDTTADPAADDLELPPDLLPALLSLSTHLSLLASLLPPSILAATYRRIVDHLSNHVVQRAVFAGWSKFTSDGGADLAREVTGWINTSTLALGTSVRRPAAPWRRLEEMGRVLALDDRFSEDVDDTGAVKWSAVLGSLRQKDEAEFDRLRDRLELRALRKEEMLDVVKRRVDCPF